MSAKLKQVNTKEVSEIEKQLLKLERELLELRISKSVQQVKDNSRFGKIKTEISRLKLKMNQTR